MENIGNSGNRRQNVIFSTEPNGSVENLIKPMENRLVVFDPSKWHRVSKVSKGKRKAFLSNVWLSKPKTFDNGDHVDKNYQSVQWINEQRLK